MTSHRRIVGLWVSFVVAIALLTGCSGGGNSSPVGMDAAIGPEATVAQLFGSWRNGSARSISLELRSATANNTALVTTSVASGQSITYRDLSGTAWPFRIASVTYSTADTAEVYSFFEPALSGSIESNPARVRIELLLNLRREQGLWQIYDLTVTIPDYLPPFSEPTATGTRPLNGTVRDGVTGDLLAGANVQLDGANLASQLKRVTDANGAFDFGQLPVGNYTLVVETGGYVIYTQNITLN